MMLPSYLHTSSRTFHQSGFRFNVDQQPASLCKVHTTLIKVLNKNIIFEVLLLALKLLMQVTIAVVCSYHFAEIFVLYSFIAR